jgi:hypothetical protein
LSRVRKEWTLEQAKAAQARFVARGGRRVGDPRSPLSQWRAMHDLDEIRVRFERGDDYALAMALRICANNSLLMPPWVVRAYIDRFDAVHTYRADSWEALFGPAIPKGKHLAALRKRWEYSIAVWNEVSEVQRTRNTKQQRKGGTPIDDLLFASIGKKLGLSVTLTKEYYAIEKRLYAAQLAEWTQPGNPIGELLRPYRKSPKK